MTIDVDAALRAIGDAPDDEGRRRVLADLLIEQGDPRGEFIVLQLLVAVNQASAAMSQRARELLARHRGAWLKELEGVLVLGDQSFRMEGGFPVAGTLAPGVTLARLRGAFSSPMFLTLRELRGPDALVLEALASPKMRALSRVTAAGSRFLAEIEQHAPPGRLEELTLDFAPREDDLGLLATSPAFGRLRTLRVSQAGRTTVDLGQLTQALAGHASLEVLRASGAVSGLEALAKAWPTLRLKRAVISQRVVGAGVSVSGESTIDYERQEDGTHVLFSGFRAKELLALRRLVPPGTTHVGLICGELRSQGVDPERVLGAFEPWSPTLNGRGQGGG